MSRYHVPHPNSAIARSFPTLQAARAYARYHVIDASEIVDTEQTPSTATLRQTSEIDMLAGKYTPPAAPQPGSDTARAVARRRQAEQAGADQWATVEVHPADRASAEADAAMLIRLGLTPGRTYYPAGHPLNTWGINSWSAQKQSLGDSLPMRECAPMIEHAVAAERRRDVRCNLSQLRLQVNEGQLRLNRGNGTAGIGVEYNAWRQLVSAVGLFPNLDKLQRWDAEEIAWTWNHWADRGAIESRPVLMRGRNGTGDWSAYALVGGTAKGYTPFDADRVARVVADAIPNARGSMVYNPNDTSLTIEAVSMRDLPPVVGEVYKGAIKGTSRDDGQGSASFWGALWRALCRNLSSETLEIDAVRRVHRGREQSIARAIRRSIQANARAIAQGFPAFAQAAETLSQVDAATHVAEHVKGASKACQGTPQDMRDALTAIVAADLDGVTSTLAPAVARGMRDAARRDAVVEALLRGLDGEQDTSSLRAVGNAVTAIHKQRRVPALVVAQAEQVGGALQRRFLSQLGAAQA